VNRWTLQSRAGLSLSVLVGFLTACGVVGSPIPPEDVAVTPTISRQKQQHAVQEQKKEAVETEEAKQEAAEQALQEPDVKLPPLKPVGTR